MKKVLLNFNRSLFLGFAIIGLAILFTGCLKKGDDVDIPSAGLMTFNLAPDQQSVVVALSGSTVSRTPMGYTSFSGLYQNIFIGTRNVESFDYPDETPLDFNRIQFRK